MRTHAKKQIAILLSVCLLLGVLVPIPVFGIGDPVVTITFTPETVTQSNAVQRVAMNVHVEPATTVGASYYVKYDSALTYVGFESDTVKAEINGQNAGTAEIDVLAVPKNGSTSDIGTFYFDVPASTAGSSYEFKLSQAVVHYPSYGGRNANDVSKTLDVTKGRTAALTGPAAAQTGGTNDTVEYTINVSGDAYQSAELELTYNNLLEFVSVDNQGSITAKNNTVSIVQCGESQTPTYKVKFKAVAAGEAVVTLTSAAFGTSDTAVSENLTPATITTSTVRTAISKAFFTVTLPDGTTDTVANGGTYVYNPQFTETNKYDYTVTATINDESVEVVDNGDGTYTIKNVSGDLKIAYTRSLKKYTVTFTSKTLTNKLPADGIVTHGEPYTFKMPEDIGYKLEVTEATINAVEYDCPAPQAGVVTIPGDAVVGNIVINIERTEALVTIEGSGKNDASGAESVKLGSEYELTLNKVEGYQYNVTATMDNSDVTPVVNGNMYTINNVTGPIVFHIEKSVNTNVSTREYIKLNGTSVWLIKNTVAQLSDGVYTYNGTKMVWSEAYNAYCCLVISETEPDPSADTLALTSGTSKVLAKSCDVNRSGKVDANDAQLIYDLYNKKYTNFSVVSMEKFLLADTNVDDYVDTTDVITVVDSIIAK